MSRGNRRKGNKHSGKEVGKNNHLRNNKNVRRVDMGVGNFYGGNGQQSPTFAFEYDGIEYWGSAKSKLDKIVICEKDLLLNATGMAYSQRPFVKSTPAWLEINSSGDVPLNQAVFDWTDYKPPPSNIDIIWWKSIIKQAKDNGVTRIVCCCVAGHGRTGTSLASLAIASGKCKEPSEAINLIRKVYYNKAVETDGQELYVYLLVYNEDDITFEDEDTLDDKNFDSYHGKKTSYVSEHLHDYKQDDVWEL